MSTALATAMASKPRSALGRFFSAENRYLSPLFITLILLVGNLSFGLLESFSRTLLAIGTALALEIVLGRWFWGKIPNLASGYITGISVGILLRSHSMGQYGLAHGGDLGAGSFYRLPRSALSYHRDICCLTCGLGAIAHADHRASVSGRSRSHHRPDVPAFRFFHDYRSQNHRDSELGADPGGRIGGCRRVRSTPRAHRQCTIFRLDDCRTAMLVEMRRSSRPAKSHA
jgi:hypothetical protein